MGNTAHCLCDAALALILLFPPFQCGIKFREIFPCLRSSFKPFAYIKRNTAFNHFFHSFVLAEAAAGITVSAIVVTKYKGKNCGRKFVQIAQTVDFPEIIVKRT